ncbi:MAG: hypothetical protein K0S25_874 [Bacillus sp. (in: firmicutes)]|jgi:hypothetical protein|nr:hypothetical protein [Bacillus sp. (in: firmicutes)]
MQKINQHMSIFELQSFRTLKPRDQKKGEHHTFFSNMDSAVRLLGAVQMDCDESMETGNKR